MTIIFWSIFELSYAVPFPPTSILHPLNMPNPDALAETLHVGSTVIVVRLEQLPKHEPQSVTPLPSKPLRSRDGSAVSFEKVYFMRHTSFRFSQPVTDLSFEQPLNQ